MLTVCGSLQRGSANRAALDVVIAALRSRGADVDDFDGLAALPPMDVDRADDPDPVVADWRARAAAADVAVIAAPEYAGGVAGTVKNALDWLVGAGALYPTPVGVISAGTSGGAQARADLVRTLSWQGTLVVASLGVPAPSPKTAVDESGARHIVDPATLDALHAFVASVHAAASLDHDARVPLARSVAAASGVDPGRVSPS